MFFKKLFIMLLVLSFLPSISFADTASLEKRLNELEQEVAILKRQIEVEKEETVKKAADTPIITANSKDGFSIKSQDDAFKLRFRGVVQADARVFTANKKDLSGTTDGLLVRRARPILEGSVGKNFGFYLMPDFAQSPNNNQAVLVDAYADFKVNPAVNIRGGKFKTPFGIERLQSDPVANFMETGLPTNLVPNRDVGFQLSGDVLKETVNYSVGIFNGGPDLASVDTGDTNNDKDVIGRVFVTPFKNSTSFESLKGLGLGVAASYGHREGTTLSSYRSPGQATVFSYGSDVYANGDHTRLSPQAYFYKGSLGIIGEYVQSEQELSRNVSGNVNRQTFDNKAWQVSTNYILTGEIASYKGFSPLKPFDLSKGTWGAFEIVGRYGQLTLDEEIFDNGFANLNSAIGQENAAGVGLNWYPTRNVRLSLNYEKTVFERGAGQGKDREDENVVSSRFQLTF